MSTEGDRRASPQERRAARMAFDALVEVGAELGPSFEAQAIDISEEGMHLRTAYLPEVGQPLTFRFDAGADKQVAAKGEVIWKQEAGKGGEFGVRFTDLDAQSTVALGQVLGLCAPPPQPPGSRVRLHIDGLGSPMRARVKEASGSEITAFSELGFLQVGKQLELEDAQTGKKRPASIDRVEVEIDPDSRVPQLVVTLRYDDEAGHAAAEAPAEIAVEEEDAVQAEAPRDVTPESTPAEDPAEPHLEAPAEARSALPPAPPPEQDVSIEEASDKMRGALARGAAKVGPAFAKMMTRAKVTMALLAAKRKAQLKDSIPIPLRRRTAPPPGGALHASGRKVVRSDPEEQARAIPDPDAPEKKRIITKRRAIVGSTVALAALLSLVALKKPAPQAPLASAPPPDTAMSPITSTPGGSPTSEPITPTLAAPLSPPDPTSLSAAAKDDKEAKAPKPKGKVAPFGNGPVAHGNVLHLKMDGPIDKIEGAQQPTGFTVVIPSRRSLEPAGPLAARDGRIASIRVSNDPNGAELALAFKDGVPNYQVRAKGDTLEIALAPIGQVAPQAKHNDGVKPHGKSHKDGAKR